MASHGMMPKIAIKMKFIYYGVCAILAGFVIYALAAGQCLFAGGCT